MKIEENISEASERTQMENSKKTILTVGIPSVIGISYLLPWGMSEEFDKDLLSRNFFQPFQTKRELLSPMGTEKQILQSTHRIAFGVLGFDGRHISIMTPASMKLGANKS